MQTSIFIAEYSPDDNGYIATSRDYPGLSAFGNTARLAIEEAIIAAEGFDKVREEDERKALSSQ
jgi:predicted RNase H-like HicB family nuclease